MVNGQITYYYRQMDTVDKDKRPSAWRNSTGGLVWSVIETTPGLFEIYAVVPIMTRQSPQYPQVQQTTVSTNTLTVKVFPPDTITLPMPMTVPFTQLFLPNSTSTAAFKTATTLAFPVQCQGHQLGNLPNVSAVLEDLVSRVAFGVPKFPIANENITKTGINGVVTGGNILDGKSITIARDELALLQRFFPVTSGGINPYPPGYVFDSYKQTLKLVIPDFNGDSQIFPLGPRFTIIIKSTNGLASPVTITAF
jgi:hypothetical protein